jgi:hypothetical protein
MKRSKTLTFLLELPLSVDAGQAKRLRAHFEAARCLYNALLGEAMKRLRQMRADPAWQEARAIPHAQKQGRKEAFIRLRQEYGFSEYALINFAKDANCTWIRDHIDSMMAQTLATRAYRAVNRVCLGEAKKVRFRSKEVQRDLYSAWLAAHLDLPDIIPSIAHDEWEGADLRLRAAVEVLQQRTKEGQVLPRNVGIPRARARLPQSLAPNQLELVYRRGRLETLG